jgi:hypothetical protein
MWVSRAVFVWYFTKSDNAAIRHEVNILCMRRDQVVTEEDLVIEFLCRSAGKATRCSAHWCPLVWTLAAVGALVVVPVSTTAQRFFTCFDFNLHEQGLY